MSPASTAVLSVKIKRCMVHEDSGRIGFAWVVGKNLKTPNLSPMADGTITQGGIQGLGSPLYICGQCSLSFLLLNSITSLPHDR